MDRLIKPARIVACCVLTIALLITYVFTLYKVQIRDSDKYSNSLDADLIATTTRVTAARGNILDRNGRLLVSSKEYNSLAINSKELFALDDPNAAILNLINAITTYGSDYVDTLPITKESPFKYVKDMTNLQEMMLNAFLEYYELDEDTSAVELLAFMRETFEIDGNYNAEEARIIAGIRYEIKIRSIISTSQYFLVENVDTDLILYLSERNLPGFYVDTSYTREYDTPYACHLLGYIGSMSPEEYEIYSEDGYNMNADVGKIGVEKAFESYLHGSDGVRTSITTTTSGALIDSEYDVQPEPGNNVYLTIDIDLQAEAENALNSYITNENTRREEQNATLGEDAEESDGYKQLITGGAVAIVDVKTGEPLTLASYPNYDITTFLDNYNELLEDPNTPLVNRALQGTYAPGSTFKPVTALAALNEGFITGDTTIFDAGIFTKYAYAGYSPTCWAYSSGGGHGTINVVDALKYSCNYFFYTVGDMIGIENISKYATMFGLGQATGIELMESTGVVATPEYKKDTLDEEWYAGNTLQAAIGQSYNLFTPLQLASYTATLANNGTRYSSSILKEVKSFDYSSTVYTRSTEILDELEIDDSYFDLVHEGMIAVCNASDGTASSVFADAPVTVAGKTGTAQTGENTDNAVFVCYAPAEDPEIAMAVVVEKGAGGSTVSPIARDIIDYYFTSGTTTASASLQTENTLLR
ncbi:MAG: penicillin-binding transpeptidase domain-containing protein [Oscillospiraceae bacterium]|jgi:penicillin-binding protein 2